MRKLINRKFSLYPKTDKIIEVREELFSIMLDKYKDCLDSGMTEEESYRAAADMMADYKDAIKEVETGSSLSALRKNLIGLATFTSFYFIAVTFIYLFVSLVVMKTFEKTWLIVVAGSFLYLLYLSVLFFGYARLFNFHVLKRVGIGLIFLSLVPIIYIFPSLYLRVVHDKNIWPFSWLVVLPLGVLYLLTDYLDNKNRMSTLERNLKFIGAGLLLTTSLYLSLSIWYQAWGSAWLIYVLFLALLSLTFLSPKRWARKT